MMKISPEIKIAVAFMKDFREKGVLVKR